MKHPSFITLPAFVAFAAALTFMLLTNALADVMQAPVGHLVENNFQSETDDVLRQFNQYDQDIQQDYQTEQTAIERTYQYYQSVIEEEFRSYERRILSVWPEAEVSTRKKWVEYSKDFKIRQAVDFETGEIRIEIILPDDRTGEAGALFQQQLMDLIRQNQQSAFDRDQLAQSIEMRLKQQTPQHIQTGTAGTTPIMARILTGQSQPSEADIRKAVEELQRRAEISSRQSRADDSRVASLRTTMPADAVQRKALDYKADVSAFARQRNISEALVLAVMHTESAFNPMARSHIPAFGLMQIVPQSAGKDVSKLIYGEEKLLSPSYLYNERNNINAGTTYLYILYYQYLNRINDPVSRLYCTIAAYNTGAGNVARAFTGTTSINSAVGIINSKPSQQVYYHLKNNLPHQETRDYLERVVRRMDIYSNF